MKIVFMGTPAFAVPSLKRLISEFNVELILTQPDRPKGRGNKVSMSPIKEVALENNIEICQPEKLKNSMETIERIKSIKPDYIIVVAYGQILTKEILDIPKYACINLHASLLPKLRGAAPLNWAIINGEKESGNTTMIMAKGIDTGDMLLSSKVSIDENMTFGELHDKLMEDGAELLYKTINMFTLGEIEPQKQNDEIHTKAPLLTKENTKIDWNKSAEEINNLVRGLNPAPGAYTYMKEEKVKIYNGDVVSSVNKERPGYVTEVGKDYIAISTGNGEYRIKKLQFPGKKPMEASEYIRGHKIDKDFVFSNEVVKR